MADADESFYWNVDPDLIASATSELFPKIIESVALVSMVPRDEGDVKFALELGVAIMMDKPIILLVYDGRTITDHLSRVADDIVFADEDDEVTANRLMVSISNLVNTPDAT